MQHNPDLGHSAVSRRAEGMTTKRYYSWRVVGFHVTVRQHAVTPRNFPLELTASNSGASDLEQQRTHQHQKRKVGNLSSSC